MSKSAEVGKTTELQDGTMKETTVRGKKLLLARIGDKYYVAESRCPHLGANLTKGALHGSILTCPLHGSQFDLSDGHVVRWTGWTGFVSRINQALRPPKALKVYPAKVEGDRILAEF